MTFQETHIGNLTGCIRAGVAEDAILQALLSKGLILKESHKSVTTRVGEWVLKRTKRQCGLGPIKRTLLRRRYRQPWLAALHLTDHGIPVPSPIAWMETIRCGIIIDSTFVCQFLDGYSNVEVFAKKIAGEPDQVDDFLSGLAGAVNQLNGTKAHHADLSGKNIFTKDGKSFYFIDLDDITLNRDITAQLRLKNHVQLYDSFCDFIGPEPLRGFIAAMAPEADPDVYLPQVQRLQQIRRSRHIG